jgi:hypothetical protein
LVFEGNTRSLQASGRRSQLPMKTHHDVKAREEEVAGLEALIAAGSGL